MRRVPSEMIKLHYRERRESTDLACSRITVTIADASELNVIVGNTGVKKGFSDSTLR